MSTPTNAPTTINATTINATTQLAAPAELAPDASRVQLALNVADLEASIEFYSALFQTAPNKVRPGYANFAIAQPPLKLVLIAGAGEPGTLNHVGVEVASTDVVLHAARRMGALGTETDVQAQTSCCYALQDKVWVTGPDNAWEIYTVLADAPAMAPVGGGCCGEPATAAIDADDHAAAADVASAANASCC